MLADRLQAVDPSARRAPTCATRVVWRGHSSAWSPPLTGMPPGPPRRPGRRPFGCIGISRSTDVLNRRIDQRARWLFDHGLVEEVRGLLEAGHDPRQAPLTGHGYGEAARYLAGEWSLEEAVAVTARRTRQYAKRQRTWFRRDPRIAWLDAGDAPGDDPALLAEAERLLGAVLP